MNVKQIISTFPEDPVISRGIALGLISLAIATSLMWQQLVVEPRLQAADDHYGLNIKVAANRVDIYMAQFSRQLGSIANRPAVIESFSKANQKALNQLETDIAKSVITDAQAVYLIGRSQRRHQDNLGYAAKQMVIQTLAGGPAMPRAVKIDGRWQLLISRAVPDEHATNGIGGLILLSLSMQGLTTALSVADTTNGSLEFQQTVPNRGSIAVIEMGERSALTDASQQLPATELFDTSNDLWKIAFTPSPTLAQKIDRELPPFWWFFTLALGVMVLSLLGLVNLRRKTKARQTAIFVEKDNAEDALFAPELDASTELSPAEKLKPQQPQPISQSPEPASQQSIENPFRAPDVVFRDYDIRGIAGTEITPEFAARLGKTLGNIILKNGHRAMYVGRDGRLSSPELAAALKSGLQFAGCSVIDLGEITTPVLNFAVHNDTQSSCGVMVTASHNPAQYNGFKIIIQGQVIAGKALQLLKPMLQVQHLAAAQQGNSNVHDIVPHYVRHIVGQSPIDRSFRIVVDAGNAVAGPVALQLFDNLGCLAFPMHCEVDGSFPNHEPNPADEKNLEGLISKVKEVNADLGFALDGDGDRLVVISGSGEIIWPDRLMMVFAQDILARNPGADIVFDVKSSKRLAEVVRQHSGRPVMCKTGHSHVRKAVQQNKAPLGGEYSGHIFFNDRWKGFDDGLYAAVRLLEILCAQEDHQTLDSMISEFESSSYTPEILIPVDESEKFDLMTTLAAGCQFIGAEIITLDGLRVEYASGWGLIRASNTSASLTLRFEADDDQSLEEIKQRFREELSPFINNMEKYI
ncbi:MAG: phosphomannomutase/phosphoglucomutase [Porticoccaceae bacterium]|nr:phosphomannomutase/phosphoglucomutase [Porticoccaceae bacterium]